MAVDLAKRVERRAANQARRADLERRDREHGGSVSIAALEAERAERDALRDWPSYRPSVTVDDLQLAKRGEVPTDPRRISIGRLWIDCGAAVRRWGRAYKRDAALTLRSDALLLLVDWPRHGAAPRSIDLGGSGGLPLRRDWLERGEDGPERLTALAWRALHAAVKQAADSPSARAEREQAETETPTDPVDIAAAVETHQRETDAPTRLPDALAPETLARLLDLPLDAARAIVARAYPATAPSDLAASWRMTPDSLKVALSRGAAIVRERFPDYGDLLAALDRAADAYRRETCTALALALLDLRNGGTDLDAARVIACDWRSVTGELPPERRALIVAALNAARRARIRGDWRGIDPERVAASVARMLPAEIKRARVSAERASRG